RYKKNQTLLSDAPPKYVPFVSEFRNLSKDLKRSPGKTGPEKAIRIPIKFVSTFVPTMWDSLVSLPPALIYLAKNPKQIKNIPSNLVSGVKQDITLIKADPVTGFAKVGGEWYAFGVFGKGL